MKLKNLFVWMLIVGCNGLLFSSTSEERKARKKQVILLFEKAQNNLGVPVTETLDGNLDSDKFRAQVMNLVWLRHQNYGFQIAVCHQEMTIVAVEQPCNSCCARSSKTTN